MILGLDLSSSCTGYGILDTKDNKVAVVDYGQFKPSANMSHGAKYGFITHQIRALLKEYPIDTVVLEMYFVGGFKSQGTFICSELRGSLKLMLAMDFPSIVLAEDIFPSSLKKIITGNGRAEKIEVAKAILGKLGMVYSNLSGKGSKCSFVVDGQKYADDVSDALALAYCHYLKGDTCPMRVSQ